LILLEIFLFVVDVDIQCNIFFLWQRSFFSILNYIKLSKIVFELYRLIFAFEEVLYEFSISKELWFTITFDLQIHEFVLELFCDFHCISPVSRWTDIAFWILFHMRTTVKFHTLPALYRLEYYPITERTGKFFKFRWR
jgi:hypothetical protein